eukprot:10941936-Lingulodinium_polyedra.AAC.1
MARSGPADRRRRAAPPRRAQPTWPRQALLPSRLAASTWRSTANRGRGIPHSPRHQHARAPAHRPSGLTPAAR